MREESHIINCEQIPQIRLPSSCIHNSTVNFVSKFDCIVSSSVILTVNLTSMSPDCIESFATEVNKSLEPRRGFVAAIDDVRHIRRQHERNPISLVPIKQTKMGSSGGWESGGWESGDGERAMGCALNAVG